MGIGEVIDLHRRSGCARQIGRASAYAVGIACSDLAFVRHSSQAQLGYNLGATFH
ncbi:MAG: hypothetical protein J4F49_11710 [Rhodobacteraceae bacterium]|nr:hypothetical protein [Paracoccaceae bacterium]